MNAEEKAWIDYAEWTPDNYRARITELEAALRQIIDSAEWLDIDDGIEATARAALEKKP